MSHITTFHCEVRDDEAIKQTVDRFLRLGRSAGFVRREGRLPEIYLDGSRFEVNGDGSILADAYHKSKVNEFVQHYTIENAKLQAKRQGHTDFEERVLEDGSIELTINA